MESRMDKYYKEDIQNFERTRKNAGLYREISEEISQLDNLPVSSNADVIDINGLKEMISSRSEYQKAKELGKTFVRERPIREEAKEKKPERVYDINVLLENAKKEVDRSNSVKDKRINPNFLAQMEDANIPESDEAMALSDFAVEKKNGEVSKDDSLPLDILADLKGSDNTVVTDPIVKDEVTMIKKIKDGETFYSGSYTFSKKDFAVDEMDDSFAEEKSHTGIKIFFLVVGLLALAVVIYLIITKYVLK